MANDAPPPWLQTGLSRALIALTEGRIPERPQAPAEFENAADPTGVHRVPEVGELTVRRGAQRLVARLRAVDYDAFVVGRGAHYVPGLDAYLRFVVAPGGAVALAWDSVLVVAPAVPRETLSGR